MATPRPLQTDEEEVQEANLAFYDCLRSLDLARMESVWLHEPWVQCLHPGWELLVGWEEVRKSWADIFRSTTRMMVSINRPLARVVGDAAWVSCLENVTTTYEGGFTTGVVEATNIYVRRQGKWLLAHHHTTMQPGRQPPGTSSTVQ